MKNLLKLVGSAKPSLVAMNATVQSVCTDRLDGALDEVAARRGVNTTIVTSCGARSVSAISRTKSKSVCEAEG